MIYVIERDSLHVYDLHEERCCTSIVRVKNKSQFFCSPFSPYFTFKIL